MHSRQRHLITLLAIATLPSAASAAPSLTALQGAWWRDCQSPAAEFVIEGSEYYGDFEGRFPLRLDGDVLVFEAGLGAGHSTQVMQRPRRFRVLAVTPESLRLRPLPPQVAAADWSLRSCTEPSAR